MKTAVVWLTDGSGVYLSDLEVLPASHPGLGGGPVAYKGTLDTAVPVGTARICGAADDVFVPEAEWCVGFPGGAEPYIADPARLTEDSPVILQGMIEGKWLGRLATEAWQGASVGNNLLADGPGIRTTLGELETAASGEVIVQYPLEGDQVRIQRGRLADLRSQNILELVRAVLEHVRVSRRQVAWVNLSAQGTEAALVNEPIRLASALKAAGVAPAELFAPGGLSRLVPVFVAGVMADGLAVPPETTIGLEVTDGDGFVTGRGRLSWHLET